jgi:hypothetical protein
VTFRRKVHHHVRLITGKHPIQPGAIADVDLLEGITIAVGHYRQRLQVTGIGQLIHYHHAVAGGLDDMPHDRRADKSGAAGD